MEHLLADLDLAPLPADEIGSWAAAEPEQLAVQLWALARTVAIFGLESVAGMFVESRGAQEILDRLAVDDLTDLPLAEPWARGFTHVLAGCAARLIPDGASRHDVAVNAELDGERYGVEVTVLRGIDAETPAEQTDRLLRAIGAWDAARRRAVAIQATDEHHDDLRFATATLARIAAKEGR